jgi:hypothetical protein
MVINKKFNDVKNQTYFLYDNKIYKKLNSITAQLLFSLDSIPQTVNIANNNRPKDYNTKEYEFPDIGYSNIYFLVNQEVGELDKEQIIELIREYDLKNRKETKFSELNFEDVFLAYKDGIEREYKKINHYKALPLVPNITFSDNYEKIRIVVNCSALLLEPKYQNIIINNVNIARYGEYLNSELLLIRIDNYRPDYILEDNIISIINSDDLITKLEYIKDKILDSETWILMTIKNSRNLFRNLDFSDFVIKKFGVTEETIKKIGYNTTFIVISKIMEQKIFENLKDSYSFYKTDSLDNEDKKYISTGEIEIEKEEKYFNPYKLVVFEYNEKVFTRTFDEVNLRRILGITETDKLYFSNIEKKFGV